MADRHGDSERPLLTDSYGAWLSDSEAVIGGMSLPPSSTSNWLSDDADGDTDGEVGTMEGRDSTLPSTGKGESGGKGGKGVPEGSPHHVQGQMREFMQAVRLIYLVPLQSGSDRCARIWISSA